jgi:hypothetical protein
MGMLRSTTMLNPVSAAWNTVARFEDYQAAQRAVDRLSDGGFPVRKLDIVGSDPRLVERVTTGTVASASAASSQRGSARPATAPGRRARAGSAPPAAFSGRILFSGSFLGTKGPQKLPEAEILPNIFD